MTKHIATVKAVDLHRWLSDVVPFAGRDETLPMLTAVHVESDGHRLLAVTTDKFTMGVSKLDFETDHVKDSPACEKSEHHSAQFNLAPDDVSTLLKTSKTLKRDRATRIVSISEDPNSTIEFKFWSGEQVSVKLSVKPFDVDVPKWRQLFPDSGSEKPREATGFNSKYLARFAQVESYDDLMRVFMFDEGHYANSQRKPVVVAIGSNFIGLIMPVRLRDLHEYERPEWIG